MLHGIPLDNRIFKGVVAHHDAFLYFEIVA